ncbi:MAG: type II glyceraldehyde-3-phosphate dehydrogenase [Thermoplasmata archaeon]|nr:type II glyceraldehyde-3-phosphate dehydrogenase [Candidatus Thermoplasmatota archaeon]MCK4948841.1 type II glyceraldehyde-3-phosphate dehydrogenase [Thermoplasmata archaeon]
MAVKVAINGYGTIGKRIADAVASQNDMEVIGVTKTRPTYEAKMAVLRGFPFYAASKEFMERFEAKGIEVQGSLDDLLQEADVVIDGTPKNSGYKEVYEKAGVKAIWQGGEKHELTGLSFNALANYDDAFGADCLRVVSCNTTGLIRTLYPLHKEFGVEFVMAVMIRRGADPWDTKRGPINAIEPVLKVPSHHGPDVQTVMPYLNIQTTAVKVPTTIMHLHSMMVKLKQDVSTEDVLSLWEDSPRILLVEGEEGIKSTAQIMEMSRDMGRTRTDLYEIAVWRDGTHVVGDTLYYYQAIHQESDVVPENVDAIRAMTEIEKENMKSIKKTDLALGIEC